jgi:MFS family permease
MAGKKFNIVYIVGLIITTILSIWIIISGVISLNVTFVIFFWVVKFLSGFGLILGIANGFLIVLDKTKNKLAKKGTNAIIIFQIVIPILLIIYAIDKIISSYLGTGGLSMTGVWADVYVWMDNIIYIYGILSLLLSLYIIPIIKDEIQDAVELGKLSWWKKKAKQVGRGIKKKYFRLKKDFAKAQIQDQMSVKDILELWKNKFAINLLLILAIGTFIFTPVAFICVMFWLRLYVFFRSETNKYERLFLMGSMIWVGIIAAVSPYVQWGIYESIIGYVWTVNIFYLIGILIGSMIFIKKLLNLQGITIQALKLKKKQRQIDKLKKEKEDLKQQLKDKTKEKVLL